MLNLVREGEEDYIEAIRYRRRLKFFENFLFSYLVHKNCLLKRLEILWFYGLADEIMS